ncbi:hypothetical protein AMECASPLE_014832 [Ameca splendens]|uniref:Secreted protein n=1 Tax=Ameca splendens TaxID=208324 RepID=A0ABV0ZAK7_9TELE
MLCICSQLRVFVFAYTMTETASWLNDRWAISRSRSRSENTVMGSFHLVKVVMHCYGPQRWNSFSRLNWHLGDLNGDSLLLSFQVPPPRGWQGDHSLSWLLLFDLWGHQFELFPPHCTK